MKFYILNFIAAFICIIFSASLSAQNSFDVSGKVLDASGEPLIGVNVTIKGTNTGTITDFDGNFMIKGAKAGDVLLVSYIGYTGKDIVVKGKESLNIVLIEDTQNLEEVLVVAYGTQKKATLTGAISSIGTADLLKSPSASVANTLAGAMTGVSSVQYSGRPGDDDAQIFIRGVGSLTEGASSPLILVDGVERPFSQMDPNEIENLTVLKDASATAVFGVRGANGVILITTKRGVEGKTSINVTSTFGMQKPTRILDNANSFDFATAVNETYSNDGFDDFYIFKPNVMEMIKNKTQPIVFPDVNWRELMLKEQASQTQHSLTISGGTKSVRFFTSIGYLFQDGLMNIFDSEYNNNFDYNRFNYRSNIDVEVTKTTSLQFNIGGRVEKRNEPNADMDGLWSQINWASPISSPGIIDGKYINRDDFYFPLALKDGFLPWYGLGYRNKTKNVLNIDFSLKQKLDFITKGLTADIKASYNGNFDYNKTRSSTIEKYVPYFKCDVDPSAPNDSTIVYRINGENKELSYGEAYGKARDWYIEGALRYSREFGNHNVSGLLLYNQSKSYYPATFTAIPSGYVGVVGRATYDYANRYLLEVNVGYNGSENFAPGDTRYGLFPAVSGGWVVSEEPFMKDQQLFDQLKIRGSYGVVGNDKLMIGNTIQRFLYIRDSYTIGSGGYNFGTTIPQNLKGADEGKMGNQTITWESAKKQNYGVDMLMLDQKLSFNADYFTEDRNDILINRSTTPGFVAANLPAVNMGRVKNWGYEFSVKWDQKINKFRYFISSNLSFSRNKILFMDETRPNEPYIAQTGHPVGTPFGRVFYDFYKDGLTYPDGTAIADHIYQLKPGDAVYYDLNNDGVINTDDEKAIGYGNRPEYILGLRYGFNYKGFDLTMQWSGATHVDRVLGDVFRTPMGGATTSRGLFQYMFDERWTPETAETALSPRFSIAGISNNYANSTLWVRDASYLRLKNMEIGYNFNVKSLKNLGVKSLRVFANGYNLITIDNLKVLDPEERGKNGGDYPITKIFNMGLNIQF
ncbi:MAG: TonB-dependent receptor [Bacteroidales bacterium]|jgi:TonB-linked SusC/RagA family outer membrane protein